MNSFEYAAQSPRFPFDPKVEFPYGYFLAMTAFARKMSEVTGKSMSLCIEEDTAIFRRISPSSVNPEFDQTRLDLMTKVDATQGLSEITEEIYAYYLGLGDSQFMEVPGVIDPENHKFGCHSYEDLGSSNTVKVHFSTRTRGGISDLAEESLPDRLSELRQMFTHISENYPNVTNVIGGSWLYNYPAYRRLYPESYTENMKRLVPYYYPQGDGLVHSMTIRGNSIWGQFLRSNGDVNEDRLKLFLENLRNATDKAGLIDAFPLPVLQPKGDIRDFYDKYGIEA